VPKKYKIKAGPKYFWKEADKSRAVAAYVGTGSFTKSAAITGIPENTLRAWAKQEWWAEESLRANKGDSDELKSTFTRIAKKATEELEERLTNGDEVLGKDGALVRKKISGKELTIIAAVSADKRRQEMDAPAQVAVQNTVEKLESLMKAFLKFKTTKIIDAEVIDAEQPQLQAQLRTGTEDGNSGPESGQSTAQSSEAGNDQGR
jgi:transposase-like protein